MRKVLGQKRKYSSWKRKVMQSDWMYNIEPFVNNAELDEDWKYFFHGYQCQFRNLVTGQIVDMNLNDYGNEEAIPDPYFLAQFIRTTETEAGVSKLIKDDFHDMSRVLDVLERNGCLKSK